MIVSGLVDNLSPLSTVYRRSPKTMTKVQIPVLVTVECKCSCFYYLATNVDNQYPGCSCIPRSPAPIFTLSSNIKMFPGHSGNLVANFDLCFSCVSKRSIYFPEIWISSCSMGVSVILGSLGKKWKLLSGSGLLAIVPECPDQITTNIKIKSPLEFYPASGASARSL